MAQNIAEWISVGLLAYLGAGTVVALPIVLFGVNRIDPIARQSSWGFRVMILPGTVALWPLLLWRWLRGGSGGVE